MSGPVDVLAVMDHAAEQLREDGYHESYGNLIAARAAVAELIEAAKQYMEVRGSTHGQSARNRLRAALVNVGGAS